MKSPLAEESPRAEECSRLEGFIFGMSTRDGDPEDFVKVVVRVRPALESGGRADSEVCTELSSNSTISIGNKSWTYDYVMGPESAQDSVFSEIAKPIVDRACEGYNGTIFAYGQTGSGKTYTMMGKEADNKMGLFNETRGLVPRSLCYLFNVLERKKSEAGEGVEILCKCSFIEIYQEIVRDLLNPAAASLQLRESLQNGVYAEGSTEVSVGNASEALEVMEKGWGNRVVGETAMNRESSRSHAIFSLTMEISERKRGVVNLKQSHLHFVDLAGSERQSQSHSEGLRLKEASAINTSLLTLGRVINAVVANRLPPYRDSKLTFLLRDSLGGNSKTCVIVNVHPLQRFVTETKSSLTFAQNVKKIRNRAVVNEAVSGQNVTDLQAEIKELKQQLRVFQNAPKDQSSGLLRECWDPFVDAMTLYQTERMKNELMHGRLAEFREKTRGQEAEIETLRQIILHKETQLEATELLLREKGDPQELKSTYLVELKKELRKWKLWQCSQKEEMVRVSELSRRLEKLLAEAGRELRMDPDTLLQVVRKAKSEASENSQKLPSAVESSTDLVNANCRLERSLRDKNEEVDELKRYLKRVQEELRTAQGEVIRKGEELRDLVQAGGHSSKLAISQLQEETIKALTPPTRDERLRRKARRTTMFTPGTGSTELAAFGTPRSHIPPVGNSIVEEDEEGSVAGRPLEGQLHAYQEMLGRLDAEKSGLEVDKLTLETDLNRLQQQLCDRDERAEALKQEAGKREKELCAQLATVEVEKKSLEEQLQEVTKTMENSKAEASELMKKYKTELGLKRDLEAKIGRQAKRCAEAESKLCDMQSLLDRSRKENTELFNQCEELRNRLAAKEEEDSENIPPTQNRLATGFQSKMKELEKEKEKVTCLTQMISERDKALGDQKCRFEAVSKELKKCREQLQEETNANTKLAGHMNSRQRIKYLDSIKEANAQLIKEKQQYMRLNCCEKAKKFWASLPAGSSSKT